MSDHDWPKYTPYEWVTRFCFFCRQTFRYIEGDTKQFDEHMKIELRLRKYVGGEFGTKDR